MNETGKKDSPGTPEPWQASFDMWLHGQMEKTLIPRTANIMTSLYYGGHVRWSPTDLEVLEPTTAHRYPLEAP